jgi:NAD(P)-dependent dehydrogenase (short-subunit alcohol dehydrogenase family)
MNKSKDTKRIFITGGASGLGRALANRYATAGWSVCIGDIEPIRGEEALSELMSLTDAAHYLPCNVTKEADLEAAAAWLEKNWGGVDIVVNNAGVAGAGGIADVSLTDWMWILEINLLGVVRGCKVFTPLFRKQGHGHFVNISSMAGLLNPPMMGSYNVSKAAVVSLSETLFFELADDKIGVSVVCPSFFRTNLVESLRSSDEGLSKLTARLVNKSKFSAEEIAAKIQTGVEQGDFLILTHDEAKTQYRVKRFIPFKLFARFVAKEKARFMGKPKVQV